MPTDSQEVDFLVWDKRANMTAFNSRYPFGLFKGRELPEFFFDDVTIFYGNNGSGKSTILSHKGVELTSLATINFNVFRRRGPCKVVLYCGSLHQNP